MEEPLTDTRTDHELLLAILKAVEAMAQIVVEEHIVQYHHGEQKKPKFTLRRAK